MIIRRFSEKLSTDTFVLTVLCAYQNIWSKKTVAGIDSTAMSMPFESVSIVGTDVSGFSSMIGRPPISMHSSSNIAGFMSSANWQSTLHIES